MTMRIANPFAGLESIVTEHYPLKRHTWYRIGGPARYFIRPQSIDQLREAIARCAESCLPISVLGLGANLLVKDEGIDGAVFRLDAEAFAKVSIDGTRVTAGAGVDLQKLIIQTVRAGLAGLETLAGIPGTVGGAIRMNAGGRFGDIGALVDRVRTMNSAGEIADHPRDEIVFEYRASDLADPLILEATLQLESADADELARRYKEVWMYKRTTQPLNTRNSGCIFKNPGGQFSAGALVDRAGLKGLRVGGAEVNTLHANFIIAHPDCPSEDVLTLIQKVRDRVLETSGIVLQTEVKIWG